MAFVPKNWQDLPSIATPLSAAALEDMEARVAAYADSITGVAGAVPKSMYNAKGIIVTGGETSGNPVAESLGPGFSFLRSNLFSPGGVDWAHGYGPTFNVRDYGATGDGLTDDRAAIQACLDAANGEGICFFPKGVYLINFKTGIRPPSNSHLVGAGWGISILKAVPNSWLDANLPAANKIGGQIIGQQATNFSNITLENLEIDGNKDLRTANSGPLIEFRGDINTPVQAQGFRMHNCYLHDSPYVGISLKAVDRVSLQHNRLENTFRDGIHLDNGCEFVNISNNIVRLAGDDALCVHGGQDNWQSKHIVISGNVVDGGGTNVFHPDANAQSLHSGGHGIVVTGSWGVVITGNYVARGGHGGIMICPVGDGEEHEVTISGNVITDSGTGAVNANGTAWTTATENGHGIRITVTQAGVGSYGNNLPESGGQAGVVPGEASIHHVNITGNEIVGSHGHGVWIAGQTAHPIFDIKIADNHILGRTSGQYTAAHGIYNPTGSARVTVQGNTIRSFTGNGIRLGHTMATPTDWIIHNNRIFQNGGGPTNKEGIVLDNLVGGQVSNNRITGGSQTYGLNWGTATFVYLSDNDFRGNGVDATVGTPGANCVQALNRDNAGALMAGNAQVGLV